MTVVPVASYELILGQQVHTSEGKGTVVGHLKNHGQLTDILVQLENKVDLLTNRQLVIRCGRGEVIPR